MARIFLADNGSRFAFDDGHGGSKRDARIAEKCIHILPNALTGQCFAVHKRTDLPADDDSACSQGQRRFGILGAGGDRLQQFICRFPVSGKLRDQRHTDRGFDLVLRGSVKSGGFNVADPFQDALILIAARENKAKSRGQK
ncbi:hypothetical protein D3C81_1479090 [compost metagenome]